jgi:hypothetical protein
MADGTEAGALRQSQYAAPGLVRHARADAPRQVLAR